MQSEQHAARSIWIYGNPDTSELGFETPDILTKYIRTDIFAEENGRYRHTERKNADVIVLSREGLMYGHFDIEEKVKPNDADRAKYPSVKFVYRVHTSTLYDQPVPLSKLAIKNIHFGRELSEDEFQKLQQLAGGTTTNYNVPLLPESTVALERVLREVQQRLRQSEFRMAVIAAYNSRCAVSGCDAVEALEAAHIAPYSRMGSNHPSNGLLLRADIHTLFDQGLIGIDPTSLAVVLAPSLKKTSYSDLDGKQLRHPANATASPNKQALAERWDDFQKSNRPHLA